jgi:hypothetical protein
MRANLVLIFVVILFYGSSLFYGFSQDDWFHLSISQAGSLIEFLAFFNPFAVSWIFFRPLSTQLPYFLAQSLFALPQAAVFLHLVMLALHSLNAILVLRLGKHFLKDTRLALILALLFAASNIHFLSLFYIGAIQQLIAFTFCILALLALVENWRRKILYLTLFTILALLSKELSIRILPILFMLSLAKTKNLKHTLRELFFPLVFGSGYVAWRILWPTGGAGEYEVSLSLATTLATSYWYTLFALGFPEHLLNFGLSLGRIDFGAYFGESWPRLLALPGMSILIFALFRRLKSAKKPVDYLLPLLAFTSLFPIIFLPTHRYPHYLDFFLVFMGIWLLQKVKTANTSLYLATFFILVSFGLGILVDQTHHWTTQRAKTSTQAMAKLQNSEACQEDAILFEGTDLEALELSYALSLANGPRIICNNPSLQLYYSGIFESPSDSVYKISIKDLIAK